MAFSFTSRSLDDIDMLFNIEPVPFFDLDMNDDMADVDHSHAPRPMAPQAPLFYPSANEMNGGAFVNPMYYDAMKMEMPQAPAPVLYPKKETQHFSRSPPSNRTGGASSLSSISSRCQTEEELLAQPVSSLTEEEKKIRRRAQVAKSARKHRKGLKEELEMLRQQVKYLQDQMAAKATTEAPAANVDMSVVVEQSAANGLTDPSIGTRVLHPYTHVPAAPEERKLALMKIADQSMQRAWTLVNAERGQSFPYFDMKLNSAGPDMEIQLVRGKIIEQFDHKTIVDATWNSVLDFSFDVDARLKRYVQVKKLMNLDADTRYGRIKIPILKTAKGVLCMESFFLVRRKIYDNHAILMWKTIDSDELFPNETQSLRNVELGCAVLETQHLPNGEKQTVMRCVVHSMPPVKAIAEPKGRISEAFLSTLCRCSDFFDDVTRNELLQSSRKLPAQ